MLGQTTVRDKENEIVAIPRLLKLIDLRGATVTLDAMGCQTAIAQEIVNGGGHYILQVKDNRPTLREHIELFFDDAQQKQHPLGDPGPDIELFSTVDAGHGRVETRTCHVPRDLSWVQGASNWSSLSGIVMLERERVDKLSGEASREARAIAPKP